MVGETVGSYRILRQLGAGAMGQVYLAEHRHLKRQAALKLLARELVDRPDLLERFFLEARATSAIAHPGIVQIFDCEVDATGRPYIVMELVAGETLAAVIARQGALSPLVAARLGRALADALAAAHGKGIVHRDLKPENMFVLPEPPDSIKLVDFGIAKLAGELQAGQVHKTRSGAVMGTPLYMSPEQCRDSAALDFRTDLYSFGCVLHEMLTGRPPFARENFGELMVAHMTEAPPDPRAANPAVPAPLAELTLELLRKDPAQRPASMRVVAERLMAYVGRMTTVPGAAASAQGSAARPTATGSVSPAAGIQAPPSAGVSTTFGASASEVLPARDAPARPPRRAAMIVAAVAVVAGLAVGGAILLARRPAVATAPPRELPVAPTPIAVPPPAAPAAAPAPVAPVFAEKAAPVLAEKEEQPKATLGSPKRGAHRETAAPPAVAAAPVAAGSMALPGAWEGPWTDHAHDQHGRLSLQLGADGSASGWMYNTSAKLSYRLLGTITPAGGLELTCQCPPGQEFVARGVVRADAAGELKGELSLASPTAVFGQTRLTLHRSTVTR
jgi:tRNA A-37 threonylcarbamoyl transferase component Bud32